MHIKDLDRLWIDLGQFCYNSDGEDWTAKLAEMRAATERHAMTRAIRFVAKAGRGYVDDPDDIQKLADEVENGETIIP